MNKTNKWWMKGIAVAALAAAPLSVPLLVAAQPPADAPPAAGSTPKEGKLMLTTVVNQMKKETGLTILLDRSVPMQDVSAPTEAATPDTLEAQLTALAQTLPKGTVWAKVNLPDRGRAYNGDAVADYVLAQAKLFGGAGMPTPAGTLEVMGQKISGDKAQVVSDTLALKPVYVLLNPTTRTASGAATGLNPNWASLTPEQQQQQAQQAAQALLNMSPEQRAGVMQQQMQTMRAMMQNMTPQQRQQMFQNMGPGVGGMQGGFGGRRRGQ